MGGSNSEGPDARITQLECQLAQMELGMPVCAVSMSVLMQVSLSVLCPLLQTYVQQHWNKVCVCAVFTSGGCVHSVQSAFAHAVFTSMYMRTKA